MLISQGQSVETYREYIELICNGLSDDEIICDIPVLETRILEFERDSIP